MKRVYQKISDNLSALVCGGEPLLTVSPDPDSVETLVNRVMQKYPVVVIDLSGAGQAVQKRLLERASEIVVVTTSMLSSLRNARTLLGELKTLKTHLKEVDLVLNMKGLAPSEEVPAQDIKAALSMSPAAVISYAPKIFAAGEATGKAVGKSREAEKIMDILMPVAEKAAATVRKGGGGGGDSDKGFDLVRLLRKTLGN